MLFKYILVIRFIRKKETEQVLQDLESTQEAVLSGDLSLWQVPPVVQEAVVQLGISDPSRQQWVQEKQQQSEGNGWVHLGIFLGQLVLIVKGGPVVALLLGSAELLQTHSEVMTQAAASNTDLDRNQGLVPRDLVEWEWLILAWVGVIADTTEILRAVRAVKAASESKPVAEALEEGIQRLAKEGCGDGSTVATSSQSGFNPKRSKPSSARLQCSRTFRK